jgi:hypothetical protein
MKLICITMLALLLPLCGLGDEQPKLKDTKENRAKEAARYLKALPPTEFVGDMILDMAQNLPVGQRKEFIDNMTRNLDFEAVEKVTLAALKRHLTAEELSALADFYSSPAGKSAMRKIGLCMAEMSPHVQLEMQKAFLKTSQAIGAKPGIDLPLPPQDKPKSPKKPESPKKP